MKHQEHIKHMFDTPKDVSELLKLVSFIHSFESYCVQYVIVNTFCCCSRKTPPEYFCRASYIVHTTSCKKKKEYYGL